MLINEEQKRAENALLKTSEEDLLALQASLGASKAVHAAAALTPVRRGPRRRRGQRHISRKDICILSIFRDLRIYLKFCLLIKERLRVHGLKQAFAHCAAKRYHSVEFAELQISHDLAHLQRVC